MPVPEYTPQPNDSALFRTLVGIDNSPNNPLSEGQAKFAYSVVRPGDITERSGYRFMVGDMGTSLGYAPPADEPLVYRTGEKLVVPDPFEDPLLLAIYKHIAGSTNK